MAEVGPDLSVLGPSVGREVQRLGLLLQEREGFGAFSVCWGTRIRVEVQPLDPQFG